MPSARASRLLGLLLLLVVVVLCTVHAVAALSSSVDNAAAATPPPFSSNSAGKLKTAEVVSVDDQGRNNNNNNINEMRQKVSIEADTTETNAKVKRRPAEPLKRWNEARTPPSWIRLPRCAEWFFQRTVIVTDRWKSDPSGHAGSGACALTAASAATLGVSNPWHMFERGLTVNAAMVAASRGADADVVAVWQVGPRTTAAQPVLANTFHTYFMNVSRDRFVGRTSVVDDCVDDDDETRRKAAASPALKSLARRLRTYNALFAAHEGRQQQQQQQQQRRPHCQQTASTDNPPANSDRVEFPLYSVVPNVLQTAQAVFSPCWRVLVSLVDRLGARHYLHSRLVEAYANARGRAWLHWPAWKNVFATRQLTLRFPIGTYDSLFSSKGHYGAVDVRLDGSDGEDDEPLRSRLDMATSSALSALRLVSFPPVAQAQHDDIHYTCSLIAVSSAHSILQEERTAVQRARETAEKAARVRDNGWNSGGAARYSPGTAAQRTGVRDTYASSSSSSRGTVVSYLLKATFQLLRWLFGESRDGVGDTGDYDVDDDPPASYFNGGFASSFPATHKNRAATAAAATTTRLRSSPAVHAARAFLQRTREELGPFQSSAISSLPMSLQRLLGSRVLSTTTQLVESEHHQTKDVEKTERDNEQPNPKQDVLFSLQWTATLPAGTPMCLGLVALPDAEGIFYATTLPTNTTNVVMPGLFLHVEETCSFDHAWLLLFLAAYAVLQLERRVAQSVVARHLVTGLTGTLLLGVMALFYVLRELQRMSVGKLAVVAALIVGGSTAALEGVFSVLWSYYHLDTLWVPGASSFAFRSGQSNKNYNNGRDDNDNDDSGYTTSSGRGDLLLIAALGFGAVFLLNDLLFNLLIPVVYLTAVTRWSVRVLLVFLWWLCLRYNAEATVLTIAGYAVLLQVRWLIVPCGRSRRRQNQQQKQQQRSQSSGTPSTAAAWTMEEPQNELPAEARQPRAYVRPIAVGHSDYARLPNREMRWKKYEEDGAACTRRALEELAAHLRANPGRYTMRLRDPNGVQRWAGTQEEEEEENGGRGSQVSDND